MYKYRIDGVMLICTSTGLMNYPCTYQSMRKKRKVECKTFSKPTLNEVSICDRLYINQPFTAFSQITFFILSTSAIYADCNGIFKMFIRVTLQKLRAPEHDRSELLVFEKSAI